MIFKEIQIERFRSFQRPTRFVFPGPGLVYLRGRNDVNPELEGNGVGKTTLLEAVYWCLFGKLSSGLSASHVANWQNPKGCRVLLTLDHNGIRRIERKWGPNSLRLSGTEVDQDTLERELAISPELFLHSILFPQEEKSSFLDLKPEEKMELMTEVLKLHIWDKASEVASEETNTAGNDIANLEGRLGELDGALASLDPEPLREQAEAWEEDHRKEVQRIRAHIRAITSPVIVSSKPDIRGLYREEATAKTVLRELTGRFNDLSAFDGGKCPTCGAKLDRAHLAAENKSLSTKIAAAKEALETIRTRVQNAEQDERKIREAEQVQGEIKNFTQRLERLVAERNPYKEQHRKLCEARIVARMRIAGLCSELRDRRKHREIAKFWIKGFKEVRLLVVDAVIAQLETEVNRTIHELGLVGWQISFDVEKATKSGGVSRGFTTFVRSPFNDDPVPWASWSGGEKQRLRLAGAFGFANLINDMTGQQPNLEMWDEPSNWLSERGIDQMLEALADRARRYRRTIIVADHRALGFGGFSQKVLIVKGKDGSRIEGQGLRISSL